MFKDMSTSKETLAEFRATKGGQSEVAGVEFAMEVLTNGHWPSDDQPTCTIPPAMGKCRSDFETFYKNKN